MDGSSRLDEARDGVVSAAREVNSFARGAAERMREHVGELKDATTEKVEQLSARKPDAYEDAIAGYNAAFTTLGDHGFSLLRQRERSTDLIELIERLVNSIANTPRTFDAQFEEIEVMRAQFLETEEFATRDLEAARASAAGAGAGITAGAAVASVAPTAAMWVATTFGTASTGTAISTLSGAAATNAAVAWLGGGALAAGGGGTAAGGALLALAGPIGWTVAGAALLTSIALFARKRFENREAKHEALTAVKQNTALVAAMDAQVRDLLQRTTVLRERLLSAYGEALEFFNADFRALTSLEQQRLAALVNNTTACAALLSERIVQADHDH